MIYETNSRGANPGKSNIEIQQANVTTVDEITQRKQALAAMIIHLNELNYQLSKGLYSFGSTRRLGEKQ